MYDHDQDGLSQQHDVGLYRISGSTLLASVVVGPNDGFVAGGFRYQSITPILLAAGTQYAVSGFTMSMPGSHASNPAGVVAAPQIGYDGSAFNLDGSLSLPAGPLDPADTFFGPRFQFTEMPVPSKSVHPFPTHDDNR